MELNRENRTSDPELANFDAYLAGEGAGLFDPGAPITVARAPARIDCMGGIADYSGSVVFEGPLGCAAVAAYQPRTDGVLRVRSVAADGHDPREAQFDLGDLRDDAGGPKGYPALRALFARDADSAWAANVLGGIPVLETAGLHTFAGGGNFLLWRELPLGAGVGSSAAMQVAALCALSVGAGLELPGVRLAALAQTVENEVVGAPCGIMDQVASALGEAGKLLAIRCRPCDLLGQHQLPPGVQVFGINSRVHHSVAGTAYATARISAFMGLKIVLDELKRRTSPAPVACLCDLEPMTYAREFRPLIPERMRGADFLAQFGPTTDTVTAIDPDVVYNVRLGTDHPVFENHRVQAFIHCLERAHKGDRTALVEAGGLMNASHWSYGWNCGLGCLETDIIARLVGERGPNRGLYGARISGGGSGGTVAILAEADAEGLVREIAVEYESRTGRAADVFTETGPGAYEFGPRTYRLSG